MLKCLYRALKFTYLDKSTCSIKHSHFRIGLQAKSSLLLWLAEYSKFLQCGFQKVLSNIYTTVTYKQFIKMSTCCFVSADKEKHTAIQIHQPFVTQLCKLHVPTVHVKAVARIFVREGFDLLFPSSFFSPLPSLPLPSGAASAYIQSIH